MSPPLPLKRAFPDLLAHDLRRPERTVGGADEAGRAALAGPIVAAACVFDWAAVSSADRERLCWLNDSKKVTPLRRAHLREVILELASRFSVCVVSVDEVNRDGVHEANLGALRAAVDGLDPDPGVCFIDHYEVAGCRRPTIPLERGDATSAAVSAASILAKTARDELMAQLADECPGYDFASNNGYTSPRHREAIRKLGISNHHRRSIYPKIYREVGLPRPPRLAGGRQTHSAT
jgi:ribonuclease HII